MRTVVSYFMEPIRHCSSDRQSNNKLKFAPPNITDCTSGGCLTNTKNYGSKPAEKAPTKQDRADLTPNTFNLGTASNGSQTICYTH